MNERKEETEVERKEGKENKKNVGEWGLKLYF